MLLTYMRLIGGEKTEPDSKTVSVLAGALAVRNAAPLLEGGDASARLLHYQSGQPYLEGHEDICISISHCGGHVAVGASKKPLGVDIECLAERRENVMRRAYSRYERLYVERSADPDAAFFEVWTRKEAFAKACGEGLKRVMLALVCDEIGPLYTIPAPDGRSRYMKTYTDISGVMISVSSAERSFPQKIEIFEPDEQWLENNLPDWA